MWHAVLNSVIIFFCAISLILCTRAVIKAQILKHVSYEILAALLHRESLLFVYNYFQLKENEVIHFFR